MYVSTKVLWLSLAIRLTREERKYSQGRVTHTGFSSQQVNGRHSGYASIWFMAVHATLLHVLGLLRLSLFAIILSCAGALPLTW